VQNIITKKEKLMAKMGYSLFHKLMQKVPSSRPGSWIFARTMHYFDALFLKVSNGRFTMTSVLAGLPVMMLTSTGAKSGLPRTLPLLCISNDAEHNKIAIIASNWGQRRNPAWYYNLKANPTATGTIRGKAITYTAHEAEGDEYEAFWQLASGTYPGYPKYKDRASHRHIPIMVLTAGTG
jgi:deazaflavin-dependent oxidoreductase (nitroreductase family)